jgi:VRR-NUC domain
MSVCADTLGPGIAAYQQMSNAGTLCDMASFDDTIAAICRTAAGAARNAAMWPADKKVLCALLCCCAANPSPSASGATNRYQGCVTDTLNAAQNAMGGDSRFKPEVSYNMRANPPEPLMERGLFGGLTTTPIPPTQGGFGQMNNRIERDFPGVPPVGGTNTRRPDVVIVNDASRPPTQDNISRVVEMKFPGDRAGAGQIDHYDSIGGKPTEELDVNECNCSDDNNTQAQVAFVTAAKTVKDAQISLGDRILSGVGAVLGAIGTAAALAVPFDGPVGEVALGSLTAALAARVFASSALSAAARQTLARGAATAWTTIFRTGAAVTP